MHNSYKLRIRHFSSYRVHLFIANLWSSSPLPPPSFYPPKRKKPFLLTQPTSAFDSGLPLLLTAAYLFFWQRLTFAFDSCLPLLLTAAYLYFWQLITSSFDSCLPLLFTAAYLCFYSGLPLLLTAAYLCFWQLPTSAFDSGLPLLLTAACSSCVDVARPSSFQDAVALPRPSVKTGIWRTELL